MIYNKSIVMIFTSILLTDKLIRDKKATIASLIQLDIQALFYNYMYEIRTSVLFKTRL